jgi:AbrB family looped-hinge helix DNA binding protein
MYTSTITSKGQTTIPKDIRKKLNLITGDNIEYYVNNDNSITLYHNDLDITHLCGLMRKTDKNVSIEDMNQTILKRRAKL